MCKALLRLNFVFHVIILSDSTVFIFFPVFKSLKNHWQLSKHQQSNIHPLLLIGFKGFPATHNFISFSLHSFIGIICTYFVYCNLDRWQGRLTAAELRWLKAPFSVVHNLAKVQLLRLKFVILIACLEQNYFGRVQQSHSSSFQK